MASKFTLLRNFGKPPRRILPISFEGPWLPKPSLNEQVVQEAAKLNLKPVKRVTIGFDPFEPSSKNVRTFLHFTSGFKVRETNLKCSFKVNVVNDRSEPTVQLELENGDKYLFKSRNLNALDLLEQINGIVLPLVPPPTETAKIETKATKKRRK